MKSLYGSVDYRLNTDGIRFKPSHRIESLEKLEPFQHLCLLYREEREWESFIIPFLKIGLQREEKCLYFSSSSTPERIREILSSYGIDVLYYESKGQLEIFHKDSSYLQQCLFSPDEMLDRLISITEGALSQGYTAIRGTGEMDWALENDEDLESLIAYESLVNSRLFDKYPFSSICQYRLDLFPPEAIKRIIMTHPYVITDAVYYNLYYTPDYDALSSSREEKELDHWLLNIKKEQQNRESLAFLANFLKHSAQPFLAFYPDGELITCNQAFLDLTGYGEKDLKRLKMDEELTPPPYRELDKKKRGDLLKLGQPQRYNKEYQNQKGERIPVEILLHSFDEESSEMYYYAFITNITERLKIEEMMGLLSHAVEQSPSAISIIDDEGRIIYVNQHYTKMTGYSQEEVKGERAFFLNKPSAEKNGVEGIWDTLREGVEWKGEVYCKKKDKTPFWASLKISPVKNYQEQKTHYLSIYEDITARKRAEREMQDLYRELKRRFVMENNLARIAQEFLDANSFEEAITFAFEKTADLLHLDGILLSLIDEREDQLEVISTYYRDPVLSANPSYLSYTSLPWLLENLQRDEIIIVHSSDDFPENAVAEKEYFLSLDLSSQGYIPLMRKEKILGFIEIQTHHHPIELNERGHIFFKTMTEMIALLYERKKMDEKIINSNNKLRHTLQRLQFTQSKLIQQEKMAGIGQLAAGVAHEINNPLGFVISNIETLEKYVLRFKKVITSYQRAKEEMREGPMKREDLQFFMDELEDIEKSNRLDFILEDLNHIFGESRDGLQRISKIVEGLRFFSRPIQKDEFEQYCLNEGIKNTLVVAKNEIKYSAQVIEDLSPLPTITAIGGQINQVLLNIIMNAVQAIKDKDFSIHEEGIIHIETYHKDEHVYCLIEDNGVGMEDTIIQKVFDPFFTTKEVGEGTGLGLSISHEIIVNKHQGEIYLESRVGEGTRFTIKIPIKRIETTKKEGSP